MQYFQSTGISIILCKFMMADIHGETKRHAMMAVVYILHYDRHQVASYIAQHRVASLGVKDLQFYQLMGASSRNEKVQDKAGELLIELGVMGTMGRKLQELVREKTLLSAYGLTEPLLKCICTFTRTNGSVCMMLRDIGLFETCQEIIRNPEYKNNPTGDEVGIH